MNKFWLKVIVGLVILAAFYTFFVYNNLVSSNESADVQWAQVESQYQRRFDLIPNLVNVAKGFATQEKTVFADIAEARTRYSGAVSVEDKVKAANQVESALGRLLMVTENYPDLKSSELFTNVSVGLEGAENRISVERQRYNDTVREYNLTVKRFPSSILASFFGFAERSYFESTKEASAAPVVQF